LPLSYWVKEHPDFLSSGLRRNMAVLADKLHTPVSSNNQDLKVLARQCLGSDKSGKWFLVVDIADGKQLAMDYLLKSNASCILFTTRFRHVDQDTDGHNAIEVGKMDRMLPSPLCH
jgi:hypothetical protein